MTLAALAFLVAATLFIGLAPFPPILATIMDFLICTPRLYPLSLFLIYGEAIKKLEGKP